MKAVSIKKITKIEEKDRYDLEIGETSCFFANGILVHNCRCVAPIGQLQSRNGKQFVSSPHILEALQPLWDINPDLIFDGELYCDKLADNFNKIVSLIKREKPTAQDLEEGRKHIQYWVYDLISSAEKNFGERNKEIKELIEKLPKDSPIRYVPTYLIKDENEASHKLEEYLNRGFEGQMIRRDLPYDIDKRSSSLLKDKVFIDEEFEIADFLEGVGNMSGMAGKVVCLLKDGRTFEAGLIGGWEYYKQLLRDKNQIIGKVGTVKYFGYTPDGKPRFGHLKAIRDYE
jgi:ATP-dependent DNA ligase